MPCDVDAVSAIAKKHNIHFIEDAAQAQGSRYKGTMVGGFGAVSCYSYYPGKNLGACGEAGGLATRDEAYYKHLLSLRNHGGTVRYYHDEVGFNMRMGGLEAASLQVKMRYLEQWNNRRRAIAKRYLTEIKNPKIKMQAQPEWADSNYHLFVVTAEDKEALVQHLIQNGIQPGFHYPVPCHLQKAYTHLGYTVGSMPHAEYLASHAVSLPMFAELTEEEVQRVIDAANAF